MLENGLHIEIPEDKIIYKIESGSRTIIPENDLSVARLFYQLNDKLMLFAKPDMHLFMEDIVLRFSL